MIGAVLNIALNFLLIPSKLGVQGAAIATCASYFVVFVIRASMRASSSRSGFMLWASRKTASC